ncbi:FG-GAP repeat protein [Leptolyngbya sp. 15MV]|nr:FG-GAP repeat protein [Leptolyngbya sp. 15MV]
MADVDADGVNDFIVGATLQNPGSAPVDIGRAYLYSGRDGRLLARLPPNNPTAGAQYGWAVSGVPDIDGDGRPDVIVGAPFYNVPSGSSFRGGIWLYRGGDWGGNIAPRLTAGSPAENGNFEFFGYSVTGLRDVTGDGRGDYVVGSPQSLSINATGKRGRVYLFNGFTGALVRNLTTPSNQNDAQFGHSVFNIPDVTGDGINDFLVGAPNETVNAVAGAGRVYVYNGVTGALVYSVASPIPTLDGQFGFSVAGGPDINGDGRGDFIVGAPGEWVNASGRVHIFSGANGALIRSVSSLFQTSNGNYGRSVHRVPDANSNGKWEFLIGALRESVPLPGVPSQSGVVYLLRNP